MSASAQERMAARLFLEAVFPTMQVLLDDDPKLHKSFANFHATVQFGARDDGDLLCCHLVFDGPHVDVIQGPAEKPDLALTFSSIEKDERPAARRPSPCPASGGNLLLLPRILSLLMGLMIMSPKNVPKTPEKQALKVKCSLYMITRALSKYNKLGDPDMQEFCRRQPDRIYQFTVADHGDPNAIACYLARQGRQLQVRPRRLRAAHAVRPLLLQERRRGDERCCKSRWSSSRPWNWAMWRPSAARIRLLSQRLHGYPAGNVDINGLDRSA